MGYLTPTVLNAKIKKEDDTKDFGIKGTTEQNESSIQGLKDAADETNNLSKSPMTSYRLRRVN